MDDIKKEQIDRIEENITFLCDEITRIKEHLMAGEDRNFRYGKRGFGDIIYFIDQLLRSNIDMPFEKIWLFIEPMLRCNDEIKVGITYEVDKNIGPIEHRDVDLIKSYDRWVKKRQEEWREQVDAERELFKTKDPNDES